MRTSILGAAAFVLGVAFAGNAGAQNVVSSDIIVDTEWSGTVVLQNTVFVKNNAVLTILPGTIVRGQPRTGAVVAGSTVGAPGGLIVTQAGTIIANGTPASPIIMTTAAVDNNADGNPDDFIGAPITNGPDGFLDEWVPGGIFLDNTPTTAPLAPLAANGRANVQLWGGIVVLGNATTNLGNNAGLGQGLNTIEGLTVPGYPVADATYGGSTGCVPGPTCVLGDDADSSGSLSYLSIRHAGDEIGLSNELNGISLGGVGSGTEFHHIEIYCNFDDGIEWFGGTVNGNHLQVVFQGDDVFDADEGYRGSNQFMVGIMPFFNASFPTPTTVYGSSGGDKGCEFDGDNSDTVPQNVNTVSGQPTPFQNGNFYNLTISGSRPSTFFNGHTNDNDGCEMRNGFAGSINNGLIFNTGGTGVAGNTSGRQGLDLAGGGLVGFTVTDNANAGLVVASAITCDNVQALGAGTAPELTTFNNGVRNVGCVNGANDPNFRINARDTAFTPTGVAGKLDASLKTIDLRISLPNSTMADGIVPPGPLTNATYRGAFDAVSAQWTDGWTALSMAGMQPVPEPGMVQLLGAGAMGLLALSRRRR